MLKIVSAAALCCLLLVPAPASAAGCIAGAVAGGVAGHLAHHGILGALGGCIAGKLIAHYTGTQTYTDVTGRMLGSDRDLNKLETEKNINVVKVSSLKGYNSGELPVAGNSAVRKLDSEIAAQPNLTAALQQAGFKPTDVLAVSAKGGGVIFVNA
jgi:hypothetical protein